MSTTTSIAEMLKFHFGSKIICSDGEDGTLVRLLFDPFSRRLQAVGVRPGRFFGRVVYIPFSAVRLATSNGIEVALSRAELSAASQKELAGMQLDNHTVVRNRDTDDKGTLRLMAIQPGSGELVYLVAHALRSGQDTLLRREMVTRIDSDAITISVPEATFAVLPAYRSDRSLQQDVENILFDVTPLHVDFDGMTVRVLDGVLYLDGNISSVLRGELVADQSAGVPGLLEVHNRLIGDDQLASDLALALARDPRTRGLPIGVYPRLGAVRLSGVVHDDQQKVAAEEIAQTFPGVRSVSNSLVVKPRTGVLSVMAPAFDGDQPDRIPGKYIRHTR